MKRVFIMNHEKLNRKLLALPLASQESIREAIARSAREIADLAESLVPRDTGRLAASIGWTWGEAPKGSMVLATLTARTGTMTATVYAGDSDAFYARWVDFGTEAITAQPFFYVAYRALRKRATGRIRRAHKKAIQKVAAT